MPAQNKLEAVARISQLTNSGPETLGPGSKERKSVFINLATGLNIPIDPSDTKQIIAKKVVESLGGVWTRNCESVGQTVTLIGLNLLLKLASVKSSQLNEVGVESSYETVFGECLAIANVILDVTPKYFDGRVCVQEMKEAESPNWRQTEWQGWYFEYKTIPALINAMGGGPRLVENTRFDYQLRRTWDLKVHSSHGQKGPMKKNAECQLNDQTAMNTLLKTEGLGLIILSGTPIYSDEFTIWHKSLRQKLGVARKPLKESFTPQKLEIFWFGDADAWTTAIEKKYISAFGQGKQQTGDSRKPKYKLNVERVRGSDFQIFSHDFR